MKNEASLSGLEIDILRVGAILYIVAWWHAYNSNTRLEMLITYCVLGVFCFISGFLLASRYPMDRPGDIAVFYRRRFFRIYPLFAAALTAFLLLGIIGPDRYWKSLLLANMFISEPLLTLWFVSMLCVLYALTPLFLVRYSTVKTVLIALCFWIVLIAIYYGGGYMDVRLSIYVVPFAAGIIAAKTAGLESVLKSKSAALLGVAVVSGALWYFPLKGNATDMLVLEAAILAAVLLFMHLSRFLAGRIPARPVQYLAYGSFALYLFHKVFYLWAGRIYHAPNFAIGVLYYACLVLPLSVVASYMIQRLYDRLLSIGSVRPKRESMAS